jgi:hypothetical protein
MTTTARRLPVLVLTLTLVPHAVGAQPPDRAEVIRRGKAATALVEITARKSHATAFCVHASGLFLTNEHAVRHAGLGGAVTLITEPGRKTQQVHSARVVRADRDLDLALLRVEGGGTFPDLALGSSDGLTELTEIVALGFPFGKSLALEKDTYPAISVNRGQITALRQKGGELWRIQLDAVLNPGNSGGPVLDGKGKVIGVVVSGVLGAQVNFAIPVSHVRRFAARPDLQLIPPRLRHADLHRPALFQVKAVSVLPADDPLTLELTLDAGDGQPRKHKLAPAAGLYRVTAAPVPLPEGPVALSVTLRYAGGLVQGAAADRTFKVGGKEVKLSELRDLHFGPKPRAQLAGGAIAEGPVSGLEALPVRLGGEEIRVPLARALQLSVEPPKSVTGLVCTVVALRAGKEVGRLTQTVAVEGIPEVRVSAAAARVPLEPVVLDRDTVVRPLPAPVSDLAVGGGGRYLILRLPAARTLAVFDVTRTRIVHSIPVADDDIRFAAGQDKLLIVHPSSGLVQRWDLNTLKREAVAKLPFKERVHTVAMGSASAGPLFLGGVPAAGSEQPAQVSLLDVQTLKLMPVKVERCIFDGPRPARASANGKVFTSWRTDATPQGVLIWVLEGDRLRVYNGGGSAGGLFPGPDGKWVFSSGQGIFSHEGKHLEGSDKDFRVGAVPAHGSAFFLGVRILNRFRPAGDEGKGLTVFLAGDWRPIVTLPALNELRGIIDPWGRDGLTVDKRLHFIPDAKLIITLPKGNDRLVLHHFDVDEALAKSGINYLLVTSQPPARAQRGQRLTYTVAAKAKAGGVTYQLESGPPGMTLTPQGQLRWDVPANYAGGETSVIIAVRDASGQQIFHTFRLTVGGP